MTQTTSLTQSIGIVLVLSLVGLLLAASAGAATTGTVGATVTPVLVSVSVTDGDVAYGILDANTNQDTLFANLDDTQTATNDGTVSADLDIKSSDAASGGTPWNLEATTGGDQFTHEFSINSGSSWSFFAADNSYSTLSTVTAGNNQTFDLRIKTPTSSSDSAEHTITVTVLATAS